MTTIETTRRGNETSQACRDKTGSMAGYHRHRRANEPACHDCREAKRTQSARDKKKPRNSAHPRVLDREATKRSLDRYLHARQERQRRRQETEQRKAIIARLYDQGGHRLISQYIAGKKLHRRRQAQADRLKQLIAEVEAIRREMIRGPGHGYVRSPR